MNTEQKITDNQAESLTKKERLELILDLRVGIEMSENNNESSDRFSWQDGIGVAITRKQAKYMVQLLCKLEETKP